AVFEKPENTHRIYQAFRDWTGLKSMFRTDQPSVEVTALYAAHRGYAVLTNHSSQVQKVTVTTTLLIHTLALIAPERTHSLSMQGASWKMELQPYSGAVVEGKKKRIQDCRRPDDRWRG